MINIFLIARGKGPRELAINTEWRPNEESHQISTRNMISDSTGESSGLLI